MLNNTKNYLPLFLISLLILLGCSSENNEREIDLPKPPVAATDWDKAADQSMTTLLRFWKPSGNYFTEGPEETQADFLYWYQAHALDVLVDAYNRKQTPAEKAIYKDYMLKWYNGVKIRNKTEGHGDNFDNWFVDDMEWIALAMLRAYKAIGDERFLASAQFLWEEIKKNWDNNLGGGLYWTQSPWPDGKDAGVWCKNACSNAPGSLLALKMYDITNDNADKEWAKNIYEWTRNNLFEPTTGIVYDGMKAAPEAIKGQIDRVPLSYNEGTFMATAAGLYKLTQDEKYLQDAKRVANYMTEVHIDEYGLLRYEGGGGNGIFRGIFVRYLLEFILDGTLDDVTEKRYIDSLNKYAENLWSKGRVADSKGGVMFGYYWYKPSLDNFNLAPQLSGCMLMEAKALNERNNK